MEERSRLVNSPDVAAVVAKFAEVDVAIVGIGELEPSQLLKTPVTIIMKPCSSCWRRAARWGISACITMMRRANRY